MSKAATELDPGQRPRPGLHDDEVAVCPCLNSTPSSHQTSCFKLHVSLNAKAGEESRPCGVPSAGRARWLLLRTDARGKVLLPDERRLLVRRQLLARGRERRAVRSMPPIVDRPREPRRRRLRSFPFRRPRSMRQRLVARPYSCASRNW